MEEMVAAVQSDENTLCYEWNLEEKGNRFYVYERYCDTNAAIAHL